MNILVLGQTGLLGKQFITSLKKEHDIKLTVAGGSHDDLLFDERLNELFKEQYDLCINCVAYTGVDQAEEEPEEARKLNVELVSKLAAFCKQSKTKLIHFSTDYVFDGSANEPYTEESECNPVTVYGKTKFESEEVIKNSLENFLIIRTSWLFGPKKQNFLTKILDLAQKHSTLKVVNDQIGSPTYTVDLVKYTLELVKQNRIGIYHITNSGTASWFDFASDFLIKFGVNGKIQPCSSNEFKTKAKRPAYSKLSISKFTTDTGVEPRSWRSAVSDYLTKI